MKKILSFTLMSLALTFLNSANAEGLASRIENALNEMYNTYMGKDQGYDIEYAICGHTHRRECKEIWSIKCVNIGNDYYFRSGMISYMSIDIN